MTDLNEDMVTGAVDKSESGRGGEGVVTWDKTDKGKSRPDSAGELCELAALLGS